jgi:UTP--glucose-1-phosphate uridylyltransferase
MAMRKQVRKAVIAVAGYGTRFLPATKNQPKEMLPIIDKPIIQYLVEECVASGIEDVILVTRFGQSSLENHFDSNVELEQQLRANGKLELLEKVQAVSKMANIVYVRQRKHFPYGNGTPLLCVKDLIDRDEAFVYMFGDDLVRADQRGETATKQLLRVWRKNTTAVILGAQEVPLDEVKRYGIVKLKPGSDEVIESIVEKPEPATTPSRLAQFGRFVLNYKIVDILDQMYRENNLGKEGELWLTDAIEEFVKRGGKAVVGEVKGRWLTTGDPLRYLKAVVEFALDREDIGPEFREYLRGLSV